MVVAVLALLVVGVALIATKLVAVPVGVALMIAALVAVVAIGERRDRSRQRSLHDPMRRLDPDRGALPTSVGPQLGDPVRNRLDVDVAAASLDQRSRHQ